MDKKEVVEYVKKRLKDEEDYILNEIGKSVTYWVLNGKQYYVDYTRNEPYDNSGDIREVGECFDKSKYNTLGEFLEEYTGERIASYCSGCGWIYIDYEYRLRDVVAPLLDTVVEKCFKELKDTQPSVINEVTELILDEDDEKKIYESFAEFIYNEDIKDLEYIEELKEIPFDDIFRRGEFAAKRQLEEELKSEKYRRSKDDEYRVIVEDLFKRYITVCGAKIDSIASTSDKYTGHMFLKRQDVYNYMDKIVYNGIEDILNVNFTKKELAILSRYKLITSNSVKNILENGIDFYEISLNS